MPAPTTLSLVKDLPDGHSALAANDPGRSLRLLFEVEWEFVRTATALICRIGEPEVKYLLCQHVWESAEHARLIRESSRVLPGFDTREQVRPAIRRVFEEAMTATDPYAALDGYYAVLKPGLLTAYRHTLHRLTSQDNENIIRLLETCIVDEQRQAREISPHIVEVPAGQWEFHLATALAELGGFLGEAARRPAPASYDWQHTKERYAHPRNRDRGPYPTGSSVFSTHPDETPVIPSLLIDPTTDARAVRIMAHITLVLRLETIDSLATVFCDTPSVSFDFHYELARQLWSESRHSQAAFRRLPSLGIDLRTLEHPLDLYPLLTQLPAHERYAVLLELAAERSPAYGCAVNRVRELNDSVAEALLEDARDDDQNLVRRGQRWRPELLAQLGDSRTVAEFIREARAKFDRLKKAEANSTRHSLPPTRRLTAAKILRLINTNPIIPAN